MVSIRSAVYMECFLDDLVDPKVWVDSWGFNQTSYCGEYKNYGAGSSTAERVKWHGYHAIKDEKIAQLYTLAKFLSGILWLYGTGVCPLYARVGEFRNKQITETDEFRNRNGFYIFILYLQEKINILLVKLVSWGIWF